MTNRKEKSHGQQRMNLLQYRNKTVSLKSNLIPWIEEILKGFDKEIVKLIQEQLTEGKRGDGTLMPPYSYLTKQSRAKAGNPVKGERISLIDYGDFWGSMFSYVGQGMIEVSSKDWKESMLVQEYGESIFLISKTQMQHLASLVRPKLDAKIAQHYAQ